MATLEYQFSTSTAFASRVIRVLTCSEFSHVDLILPGEGLLGVSGSDKSINDPGGVIIRPFNAWPYLSSPKIARVTCADDVARKTVEFVRSQIGKPFDKKALWAFLRDRAGNPNTNRDWRDPSAWYCSEVQARGLEIGGLFSYPLIQPKQLISPNTLLIYLNPFIGNVEDFL